MLLVPEKSLERGLHCCARFKPGPGFPTSFIKVFFMFYDLR